MTGLLRALLAVLLLAFVWQLLVWTAIVPERYFPPVTRVFDAFIGMVQSGTLLTALQQTTIRAIVGAIAANLLGISLGVFGDLSPSFGKTLRVVAAIIQPVPPAAIVPMAVFALGLGWQLYAFIVIMVTVWPPYLATSAGLSGINSIQVATGRMAGLSPAVILWHIKLPAAMPEIMAGIRYATTISLIAVIVSEMLTGRDGIGYLLFQKAFAIKIADVFAAMFAVGFAGAMLNLLVNLLRQILTGWHVSMLKVAR